MRLRYLTFTEDYGAGLNTEDSSPLWNIPPELMPSAAWLTLARPFMV